MFQLHKRIEAKFKDQIDAAKRARLRAFHRKYGAEYLTKLAVQQQLFIAALRPKIIANKSFCGLQKVEMEIRHASPWDYIRYRLEYTYRQETERRGCGV